MSLQIVREKSTRTARTRCPVRFGWLLSCVVILGVESWGSEFDPQLPQQLQHALQSFVDRGVISGAVVGVGTSHGLVYAEAVGYQDLETRRPMTPSTLFRIASMTKPITALAIMQLHDRGALHVNDPVEKYLPEFRNQRLLSREGGADTAVTLASPSRPITIRDLLTHTSGLPGGYPTGYADLYARRQLTLKESILLQSQRPLDFEPGTRWAYCNTGIDTLGRIIEVVSDLDYITYLERNIFQPLEMYDTTAFPRRDQRLRLAGLYEVREGRLQAAKRALIEYPEDALHPIPAGGLISSVYDLGRLYACLLRGGEWRGWRLVHQDTLGEMTRIQTGDLQTGFTPGMGFGFGFAVVKEPQGVTASLSVGSYGHGGAFGTQGWLDPQRDVYMILLIQRVGLPNADASEIRQVVQELIMSARKGH